MLLHVCDCLCDLTKGELWVDEHFRDHGLRRDRECGEVLPHQTKCGVKVVSNIQYIQL